MPNFLQTVLTISAATYTAYIPTNAPAVSTISNPANAYTVSLSTSGLSTTTVYVPVTASATATGTAGPATGTPKPDLDFHCTSTDSSNPAIAQPVLNDAVKPFCDYLSSLPIPDSKAMSLQLSINGKHVQANVNADTADIWPNAEECTNKFLTIVNGCGTKGPADGGTFWKYGGSLTVGPPKNGDSIVLGSSVTYQLDLGGDKLLLNSLREAKLRGALRITKW